MKNILKILLVVVLIFNGLMLGNAQNKKIKIYNPEENAGLQIKDALKKAKSEGKHVYLQIGGNWCSWCVLMHKFYKSDIQVDSAMKANYIVSYINYSKENKNLEVLKQLEFPQRFGFPVIVILDADGKRIHTQSTGYLEKGRGYNKKQVLEFLRNWSPNALKPENYKK